MGSRSSVARAVVDTMRSDCDRDSVGSSTLKPGRFSRDSFGVDDIVIQPSSQVGAQAWYFTQEAIAAAIEEFIWDEFHVSHNDRAFLRDVHLSELGVLIPSNISNSSRSLKRGRAFISAMNNCSSNNSPPSTALAASYGPCCGHST
jgi:hypothetical protein